MPWEGWREAPTTTVSFFFAGTERNLFCAECPSGKEAIPAAEVPISRGSDHTLQRPWERLLFGGDPNCGTVQYSLIKHPSMRHPLMLHATALLPPRRGGPGVVVPGSLSLFLGCSRVTFEMSPGQRLPIHHITVREHDGRLVAYPRPPRHRPDQVESSVPVHGRVDIDEDFEAFHFTTAYLARPNLLDTAGIAYVPIGPKILERLRAGEHLGNQPIADRHFIDELPYPIRWSVPSHLQVSYAMSKGPLGEADAVEVLKMNKIGSAPRDWDEDIIARSTAVDLASVFPGHRYRYLCSVAAVMPGGMDSDVRVVPRPVGFPSVG